MYSGKENIVQIMDDRSLPLPDPECEMPQHALSEGWPWPWYDYWMEYMELGDLYGWLERRERGGEVYDTRRHWNAIPTHPPEGSNDLNARPPARVVLRHQAFIPAPPGHLAPIDGGPTGAMTLAGGARSHLRYPDAALWKMFLDRELLFFLQFES